MVSHITPVPSDQFFIDTDDSAEAPLIVGIDFYDDVGRSRRYYFWFFGYVAKLPYEREFPEP